MNYHRKETNAMNTLRTTIGAATLTGLLLLTGCGSDPDAGNDSPGNSDTSGAPGQPGFDQGQLEEIQECLTAAGLEDAFPTDMPTERPSDFPSDPPSDFDPDNPPSDFPSDGPGGGFGALQDPEVQEALEACGIDLPTPGPSPS